MKKMIIYSILAIIFCMALFFSNNKSLAYIKSDENNVTYTSSDTKDDSVSRALKKEKNTSKIILIAIVGGVLSSSIICGILVSKHKPVRVARAANNYLDNNRVNITRRDDFFMRSSTDRIAK